MKTIITIGRQYGSGGRLIARKLAEKLNIDYYDNELLAKASELSGISNSIFEAYDEKREGFFSGILPDGITFDLSLSQKALIAQFKTIEELAKKGSCVFVGRCADYVLEGKEDYLSVFIHQPISNRIKRVIQFYEIDEKKAPDIIVKMDKKRANYYNFYTDKKWGKADSYDLCIDSSIGIDETVDLIIKALEIKQKK